MYIALNGALPYDGKTVEKVLELFLIKLQMFCLLYTSRPLVTPGFTALVEDHLSEYLNNCSCTKGSTAGDFSGRGILPKYARSPGSSTGGSLRDSPSNSPVRSKGDPARRIFRQILCAKRRNLIFFSTDKYFLSTTRMAKSAMAGRA